MKSRILGLLVAVLTAGSANALTIGDTNELGFVNFGIPSGDSNRLTYVNHLVGMALGTSDTADGQTYFRSNNDFGLLPQAVLPGLLDGTGTTINLGSGGYEYLLAKYDGPNYGSEVWDIGNLSGIITIPATGGGKYGLSGWTLFDKSPTGVPEPATLSLLGIGLAGVGFTRRRKKN